MKVILAMYHGWEIDYVCKVYSEQAISKAEMWLSTIKEEVEKLEPDMEKFGLSSYDKLDSQCFHLQHIEVIEL